MKAILSALLIMLSSLTAFASDYGDHNHAIFVVEAQNVVTGCCGNFLSARVAVAKSLIANDFRTYEVRINGAELVAPTKTEDVGSYRVFTFEKYAKGIEYHGSSASVMPYISNGIDRLYDNNEVVSLNITNGWKFKSQQAL